MSKPKEIQIPGKNYFAWKYEEQTNVKHKVLGSYAKIWISKLGCYSDTMFFDCHAGCGGYVDMSTGKITYGSSFIVEDIANSINSKRRHKNYICACETDKKYYDNIKKINEDIGKNTISLKNDDFQNILEDPRVKAYYSNHPTLFFVDPFGYTMKMASVAKMMKNNKNEVFINFMFDFISRFLNVTDESLLNDFFGSTEWKNAKTLNNDERETYLVDLYKRKLKEYTGAKYVFPYRLCYPDKDQTYYYLVHATNNIQGITYMKDSFASVNYGRVEYLGKRNDEISLLDMEEIKSYEFSNTALKAFTSKKMTFASIWEQVTEDVPYTRKDLSLALEKLQRDGKAKIERISSTRGQYKNDDIISFGDDI